jgi:hypothetical protein
VADPIYSHPDTQPIEASLGFGICTTSLRDLRDYFHLHRHEIALDGEIPMHLDANCYVCQSRQSLSIESHDGAVNWRETLRCPKCGLINRWRSGVHLFEAICQPARSSAIYITEAVTPLYRTLKQRFPNTIGSEFVEDVVSGSMIKAQGETVRIEDVTRLSFAADTFDALLSFDVLEHVPDYRKALAEFFRVLKPGGTLLWSAPFCFEEVTEIRASLLADGSVEHHLPPDYHGDPLSDQGVLCFQSFGFDILSDMQDVGFEKPGICCYCSRASGYLDRNILYVARKPPGHSSLGKSLWQRISGRPGDSLQ